MGKKNSFRIFSIVISGLKAHIDDTGNEGVINENCVQTMSGGMGIII